MRAVPRGVGIGLRRSLYEAILRTERRIDWLELVPENFIDVGGRTRTVVEACAARWPLASHGVALSIGGPDPVSLPYTRGLRTLLDDLAIGSFSDHLCYSSVRGIELHDLLPLPFTDEAVRWCAERARRAADLVGRPLILENITYYATMPGGTMSEGEFVSAVLDGADCNLLLDVNNVYVNAMNHGREPLDVLLELPLARTKEIHIAGHVREGDLLLDTHGAAVAPGVWELLREAIARVGDVPVLLEWDTDIPALDRVLDEADRAREIVESTLREHERERAAE